jgi:endonuclease/exonuclease/phosphatase (EEP) superfamily protein YafD
MHACKDRRMPVPDAPTSAGAPASPSPRRRRWTVGGIVATVIVTGIAVLLLLPDLLRLDTQQSWNALTAVRPQVLVVVTVVTLIVLAIRRRWWLGILPVLVVCAIAASFVVPRAIPHVTASTGGTTLKVLSFNVDQGGADITDLAAEIRSARPDVVVMPESGESFAGRLQAAIPSLHYRSHVVQQPGEGDVHGVTVLTAAHLGDVTSTEIEQGQFDPWVTITGGDLGKVRIVAVHSSAPTWGKIQNWPVELKSLQQWCGQTSTPTIIAGDFNASEDHLEFRQGTAGCEDAGTVTGHGLIATWPTRWPRWFGAQIDHVLGAGGVQPTSLQVLDLPGSDHRALLAQVRVP